MSKSPNDGRQMFVKFCEIYEEHFPADEAECKAFAFIMLAAYADVMGAPKTIGDHFAARAKEMMPEAKPI